MTLHLLFRFMEYTFHLPDRLLNNHGKCFNFYVMLWRHNVAREWKFPLLIGTNASALFQILVTLLPQRNLRSPRTPLVTRARLPAREHLVDMFRADLVEAREAWIGKAKDAEAAGAGIVELPGIS